MNLKVMREEEEEMHSRQFSGNSGRGPSSPSLNIPQHAEVMPRVTTAISALHMASRLSSWYYESVGYTPTLPTATMRDYYRANRSTVLSFT
jgi:hypothetical protein